MSSSRSPDPLPRKPAQKFFGHEIGADYVLPDHRQLTEYWKILEQESDRGAGRHGETGKERRQVMAGHLLWS